MEQSSPSDSYYKVMFFFLSQFFLLIDKIHTSWKRNSRKEDRRRVCDDVSEADNLISRNLLNVEQVSSFDSSVSTVLVNPQLNSKSVYGSTGKHAKINGMMCENVQEVAGNRLNSHKMHNLRLSLS